MANREINEEEFYGQYEHLTGFTPPTQPPPPSVAGSSSASPSVGSSKPPRRPTSQWWNFFERGDPFQEWNDQEKKMATYRLATCKLCKDRTNAAVYKLKDGGTGSLKKHITNKHPEALGNAAEGGPTQTTLNPTTGGIFSFNHKANRLAMAKLIPSQHLPFGFASTEDFAEMAITTMNPAFRPIPPSTMRLDVINLYRDNIAVLTSMLATLQTRVAFTSDGWESPNGLHILCITCHWIDIDWKIQKRIISFKMLEDVSSGSNIAEQILDVARFFHIADYIYRVRYILSLIKSKRACNSYFKKACQDVHVPYKKVYIDSVTRWNSTCQMLKYAVSYKRQLNHCNMKFTKYYISDEEWVSIERMCNFLEVFEYLTNLFSGIYYPTSHLVLSNILSMMINLDSFKGDPKLQPVYMDMALKLKKYFVPLPISICIGHMLDPRNKNSDLEFAITELYEYFGSNDNDEAKTKSDEAIAVMRGIYDYHRRCYYNSRTSGTTPSLTTDDNPSERKKGKLTMAWAQKRKEKYAVTTQGAGTVDELTFYFGCPTIEVDPNVNFDILSWWKENSATYPVLSILARDILTIPMSSCASESAFSCGKHQIPPHRSSMVGQTLEILVCLKDWRDAEKGRQGRGSMFDELEIDLAGLSLTDSEGEADQVTHVPGDGDESYPIYTGEFD